MVLRLSRPERQLQNTVRPQLLDGLEPTRSNVLAQLGGGRQPPTVSTQRFSPTLGGASGRARSARTFIAKPDGIADLSRVNCVVCMRVPDSSSSINFAPGRENFSR